MFGIVDGVGRMVKHKISKLLVVAFVILPILSIANSLDKGYSIKRVLGESYLLVPFFFALGYTFLREEVIMKKFLKNTMIAVFIINSMVIFQRISGFDISYELTRTFSAIPEQEYEAHSIFPELERREDLPRIRATFDHPIALGVFVATIVGLFLYCADRQVIIKSRVVNLIGLISSVIVIQLTVSRTPLGVLLIMGLLYVLLFRVPRTFLVLPLGVGIWYLYSFFGQIGWQFQQDSGRSIIISDFVSNFSTISLIGIGPGMFSDMLNPSLYGRWVLIDPLAFTIARVIESGLLYLFFFIGLVWMMYGAYRKGSRLYAEGSFERDISTLIFVIFGTNVLVSFYSISMFNSGDLPSAWFWLILGAFVGLAKRVPLEGDGHVRVPKQEPV
jgi:hypothetical protein